MKYYLVEYDVVDYLDMATGKPTTTTYEPVRILAEYDLSDAPPFIIQELDGKYTCFLPLITARTAFQDSFFSNMKFKYSQLAFL